MTARERFYSNKAFVDGYTDLIESDRMQYAMDAAMLEFHDRLKAPTDEKDAAANEWRRQGVILFRAILEGLCVKGKAPTPVRQGNLDHRA